jgi:hypothetical protein
MLKSFLNNTLFFLPLWVLETVTLGTGGLFTIIHFPGAPVMLKTGIFLFAIFGIWTLAKVYVSNLGFSSKLLWMLGMAVAPVIFMWVYHIKNKSI